MAENKDYNYAHQQLERVDLSLNDKRNYLIIAWAITYAETTGKKCSHSEFERAKQEVDWYKYRPLSAY